MSVTVGRATRRPLARAEGCTPEGQTDTPPATSAVLAPVPGSRDIRPGGALEGGRATAALAELLAANATGGDPHTVLPDRHQQNLASRLIAYLSRSADDHARTLDARPLTLTAADGHHVHLTPVLSHDGDGVVVISIHDLAQLLHRR